MRKPLLLTSIALLTLLAVLLVWRAPRVPGAEATPSGSTPAHAESTAAVPPSEVPRGRAVRRDDGKPLAACLECQKRECSNLLSECGGMTGNATEGPATGTPKSQL